MDDFETAFLNQRDRAQMPNVSVPKQNVYQRPYAHPPQEQGIDYSGGQMETEFQTRHGVQLTTDMLPFDQNFVAASKGMYNHFEGEPFTGSDQEAAEYGVELMGEFYFNFAGVPATGSQGTLYQATSIIAAGDGKKAQDFIYLMDQYERLPTFGEGAFSRMFRNMLKDPSNWAAAATLGTGKILTAGGQQATKMTARQSLRQLAGQTMVDVTTEVAKRPGTYGAIFEGTRSAAEEQMLTKTERAAGYQVSPLEEGIRTTVAGTIGAAAGGALSKLGETVFGGVAEGAPEAISKAVTDYVGGAEGRMAERAGSVQLNAGVDVPAAVDQAIVGVQKAFKKPTKDNPVTAVAPTETEPGIIAFHGSGADFDQFEIDKIGTGEGAQAYGYGLYFTDSEDIAKFYRSSVSGIDRFNQPELDTQAGSFTQELGFDAVGGTHSLSSADPDYNYYIGELDKFAVNKSENLSENSKTWEFADGSELTLQTEGVMTFDGKPLDSVYTQDVEDRFGVDIKRIAEEARNFGIRDDVGTLEDDIGMIFSNLSQGLFTKRDAKAAVESLAGPSGPGAPSRYETIYKYFIEPKIDMTRVDYLMNAGQKKGKMYKVGLDPKPEDMLDYDTPLNQQPKPVQKLIKNLVDDLLAGEPEAYDRFDFKALAAIRGESPTKGYSPTGEDILTDLQRFFEVQDFQNELYGRGDRFASEMMYDFGIPGIKYRAAGSRGAGVDDAAAERNYVIFDDKMIKILEKYGIVGPVAITGVAASQQGEAETSEAM